MSIFNYRLPIYRHFSSRKQLSASASLFHTLAQANKDGSIPDPNIPTPSDGSVPLVHLTVESAPLPHGDATAGKGGEGKRCELDEQRKKLRPRVLLATSFDIIVVAYTAASLTSTATGAT